MFRRKRKLEIIFICPDCGHTGLWSPPLPNVMRCTKCGREDYLH